MYMRSDMETLPRCGGLRASTLRSRASLKRTHPLKTEKRKFGITTKIFHILVTYIVTIHPGFKRW
jgi:hypothetical protein